METVIEGLRGFFPERDRREILSFLYRWGLDRPGVFLGNRLREMKEAGYWETVETFYRRYKKSWNGPSVPIFLFPIRSPWSLGGGKSGFTFPDKMFLFLPPSLGEKELEALFIHEYHHACRLNALEKPIEKHTLLDSIIMEGLAEFAVERSLGLEYVEKWTKRYRDRELAAAFVRLFRPNLFLPFGHPLHGKLLTGKNSVRPYLGYAVGLWLVRRAYGNRSFSVRDSIAIPAETIAEWAQMEIKEGKGRKGAGHIAENRQEKE